MYPIRLPVSKRWGIKASNLATNKHLRQALLVTKYSIKYIVSRIVPKCFASHSLFNI